MYMIRALNVTDLLVTYSGIAEHILKMYIISRVDFVCDTVNPLVKEKSSPDEENLNLRLL